MATLSWKNVATTDQSEVVVMASRLEVKSLAQVPGFLMASLALWRQALRAKGALGVALKAELSKRTFWTVSAWEDKKAVYAYAAAEPHRSSMRRKREVMKDSTFVFWTAPAGDLPVTWDEVRHRITTHRKIAP